MPHWVSDGSLCYQMWCLCDRAECKALARQWTHRDKRAFFLHVIRLAFWCPCAATDEVMRKWETVIMYVAAGNALCISYLLEKGESRIATFPAGRGEGWMKIERNIYVVGCRSQGEDLPWPKGQSNVDNLHQLILWYSHYHFANPYFFFDHTTHCINVFITHIVHISHYQLMLLQFLMV